jgi:hypothetical protein
VSTTTSPNYVRPALIGGAVMGVLSALPIVSAGNICCCLWVVSGGLVAAYVFQQNHTAPISASDGALVGLLGGLFGALIHTVVSIPIDIVIGPMQRALMQRLIDMAGNGGLPSDMRDMFERFGDRRTSGAFFIVGHIVGLMFWLCIGGVFSTLGGLLGAAIFRKPAPPAGVIDIPPAS